MQPLGKNTNGNIFKGVMCHQTMSPVAPVAYQVIILEPGIGQFREFESPRVHTRINSWELLLACGKPERVS